MRPAVVSRLALTRIPELDSAAMPVGPLAQTHTHSSIDARIGLRGMAPARGQREPGQTGRYEQIFILPLWPIFCPFTR